MEMIVRRKTEEKINTVSQLEAWRPQKGGSSSNQNFKLVMYFEKAMAGRN